MKIAVISDTHDNKNAIFELIKSVNDNDIEVMIHAGDHISPFTIDWLSRAGCRVFGVAGNNDCEKEILKTKYEERGWVFSYSTLALNLEGLIVVTHGTDQRLVDALINSGEYRVVIAGHLHKPIVNYYSNDTLYLNPGEVCGYLTNKRTYAILRMPEKSVEIIEF